VGLIFYCEKVEGLGRIIRVVSEIDKVAKGSFLVSKLRIAKKLNGSKSQIIS
jgi:hypothetical protein